jgi:hypothetical protein
MSVCPSVTTKGQLNGFSLHLILGSLLRFYRFWLKSDNNNSYFMRRPSCVSGHGSDWVGNPHYHLACQGYYDYELPMESLRGEFLASHRKWERIFHDDIIMKPKTCQINHQHKGHLPILKSQILMNTLKVLLSIHKLINKDISNKTTCRQQFLNHSVQKGLCKVHHF